MEAKIRSLEDIYFHTNAAMKKKKDDKLQMIWKCFSSSLIITITLISREEASIL